MKNLLLTLLLIAFVFNSLQAQSIQQITTLNSNDAKLEMHNLYTELNGKLYFAAGKYLWSTDGTNSGTKVVKEFSQYGGNTLPVREASVFCLTTLNNKLFFTAFDSSYGWELWTSDGTQNGTKMLVDLYPGTISGVCNVYHNQRSSNFDAPFAKANGNIYFYGCDGPTGIELWKSDGTVAGTKMVKDINLLQNKGMADIPNLRNMVVTSNGNIFFHATDSTYGDEFWVSDGTETGTKMIKDITPGKYGTGQGYEKYVVYNDKVLFDVSGSLYITDGTEQNTQMLNSNLRILSGDYVEYNNKVYFYGNTLSSGYCIFESDGTASGTKQFFEVFGDNISPGNKLINLVVHNNLLYFTGRSPNTTSQVSGLWSSDGTISGTRLVDTSYELPQNMITINNKLYYRIYNRVDSTIDVWQSDGTSVGTKKVNHSFLDFATHGSALLRNIITAGNFMTYGNNLIFPYIYNTSTLAQLYRIGQWPDNVPKTKNTSEISIYPNPAIDQVAIKGDNITQITISDISGSIIYKQTRGTANTTVNIGSWSCGLYMVAIHLSDGSTVYRKIIK